ncbi:MAG TPA: hypothetical protein VM012_02920 [Flavitalea sp.]|nr:hypothetical protein [Flavitalea sp.]
MTKKYPVIFACSFLIGCAAQKFTPTQAALASMQQKVPGITMENIQAGYKLYTEKCAGCHKLYQPVKYSVSQWDEILPKMIPRAKVTDTGNQTLIRNYLHALSK